MSEPILTIVAVVLGLLLLGVVVLVAIALLRPDATRRRVLSLFRRPPRPARTPGQDHYYKPYWS
jgi:hypothetical protein